MELKGRKVLVAGMGKSGIAAAEALIRLGADVTVCDKKDESQIDGDVYTFIKDNGIAHCFGADPKDADKQDLIVVSPGVPLSLPFIEIAKNAGVSVIGELASWRTGLARADMSPSRGPTAKRPRRRWSVRCSEMPVEKQRSSAMSESLSYQKHLMRRTTSGS